MTTNKEPTISDVARLAGVSHGTVSNVINGKPSVNRGTREAVVRAIHQLNYRPKGSARNLKKRSARNSLGLIIKELDNPFYTAVASGARQYALEKGYSIFISSSEGVHKEERRLVEQFSSQDVTGAIIAPSLEDAEAELSHLFQLKSLNFPFVLLEEIRGIQSNVVTINNTLAMKNAVKYLIDDGHSRILHFAGPEYTSHTADRIRGVREAFSESNFAFDTESMIVTAGAHMDEGKETARKVFQKLRRDEYPTAVVCYNDLIALGVISALLELGIQVPEDVSVVGADDIDFAKNSPIPLTTISTPKRALGRKAAELLIKMIESPNAINGEKITLASKLAVRQSTRPLT